MCDGRQAEVQRRLRRLGGNQSRGVGVPVRALVWLRNVQEWRLLEAAGKFSKATGNCWVLMCFFFFLFMTILSLMLLLRITAAV